MDLKKQLDEVAKTAPVVRVMVAGMPFDFNMLRLGSVFPQCIIGNLAERSGERDPDGTVVVKVQVDLLSMRVIYAYYAQSVVLTPSNDVERGLLSVACDYLGMPELADKMTAALALHEEADDVFKREDGDVKGVEEKGDDKDILVMSFSNERPNLVVRPKCDPTPEDRKIMLDETVLRAPGADLVKQELFDALGQVGGGKKEESEKKEKDRKGDEPPRYTIAHGSRTEGMSFVASVEEFEANLWALTYGVVDHDLPSALMLAGGAVLRCLHRAELPPLDAVNGFYRYLHGTTITCVEDCARVFSNADPRNETPMPGNLVAGGGGNHGEIGIAAGNFVVVNNGANGGGAVPHGDVMPHREVMDVLSRLLAFHGHSFYLSKWRARQANANTMAYLSKMRRRCAHDGDVDLFLVSKDPTEIRDAITYIHKRMASVHGQVMVIRTENSVTFMAKSTLVPKVQVVLRAYETPGQALLGFDVDSCCVGYRPGGVSVACHMASDTSSATPLKKTSSVFCTRRFARAVRCGYNLVDVSRLSTTYELRLVKYMKRGFDIAMTEPSVEEHLRQVAAILDRHPGLARYDMLIGVSRLALLLAKEWKLSKKPVPNIASDTSDYTYVGLRRIVSRLIDGSNHAPFAVGDDLVEVMGGKSSVPDWAQPRRRKIKLAEKSGLGPLCVRTRDVTAQSNKDLSANLFTGSFNPLQLAWYEGGVMLPSALAELKARREEPASAAQAAGDEFE